MFTYTLFTPKFIRAALGGLAVLCLLSFAGWRAQADRRSAAATQPGVAAATGGSHAIGVSPAAAAMLAPTFVESGATLTLTLSAANESVAVVSNGTSYTFTSNNLWSGTNSANVTGNGTTTLTVTTAGLAAFSQINISDAAVAGTSVTFNNSGANAYTDNFDIVLDDPGAGTITFNGTTSFTEANTLSASTSRNIVVNSGASVTTADGNLTLSANQQATPTMGSFVGVRVNGSLVGATGAGNVTVKSNGGDSTAISNYGVSVVNANAQITANGGAVLVEGTGGGAGTSSGNYGVYVNTGGVITNAGTGGGATVTVKGQGGNLAGTGGSNHGVLVYDAPSQITASGGAVLVEGTGGGAGTSSGNFGVLVQTGGVITNAGTSAGATVTVKGFGGNLSGTGAVNFGVYVFGANAQITSSGGALSVTGSSGSGTNNPAIRLDTGGQVVGTTGTPTVTLCGDSMEFVSTPSINAGANPVVLKPRTAGTLINLGGADVLSGSPLTLGLTDTELDQVTAGTLTIGDNTSGTITVSADLTRPASTNMSLVSGGDVTLSGGQVNTGGGTLLLDPGVAPFAVKPTKALTDVTASTLSFGSDLALVINGLTVDTQYTQLNVAGMVNLTGVNLVLSGTHTPLLTGQSFTLVNNDGADAIIGTFNGLAEGATIPNLLGSGISANISYTGGTGNDVVLTVETTPPTLVAMDDGDADNTVSGGTLLTYTVTFSEDIDAATVTAADFDNAGTAALTIGTINETSPGVFSVQVTPTTSGTLILRIPTGAVISDLAGNNLVVPVQDNDTVTVTCPTNFTVNDLGDAADAAPGNGVCVTAGNVCTLRAAIQEANALTSCSPITIGFSLNGTITIGSQLPDLTAGTRTINGNGITNTFIQANASENTVSYRVFQVTGSSANWTMNNLTVRHGGNDGTSTVGGCFSVITSANLTLSNSLIEKCRGDSGGGIFVFSGATLNLNSSTVQNNRAGQGGGGIYSQNSSLIITNSTITNNFNDNPSTIGAGGGISALSNTLFTMTGSTLSNNTITSTAGGVGGGLYITGVNGTGTASITNCLITGNSIPNTSNSTGGGIYKVASDPLTITNTVLSGNSAQGRGGAIFSGNTGGLTLNNVTISGNTSSAGNGGGIYRAASSGIINLNNTLVANNTGGDCVRSTTTPTINAQYSLIEDGLTAINGTNTANRTGDPALNANLTLTSNSIAVGAGSNALIPLGITTDLAGNARIQQGTVDIGAYESAFVANTVPTITPGGPLARQSGSAGTSETIATVSDNETGAGSLTVTAMTVPTGITVTGITNTSGTITATVAADCTATLGNNTIVLTVTDSNSGTATANLTVNVTANTAPTLTYGNVAFNAGSATTNTPTTATDNGSITGYAVQNPGTYTGTIAVNASGVVSISSAAPVGAHTITIRATDNCGITTDATFTLTVVNPLALPDPSLADPLACSGPGDNVNGSFSATNTSGVSTNLVLTATLSNVVALPGMATANQPGTIAVAAGSISWTGTLGAGQTVTVTWMGQLADTLAAGAQACSTIAATADGVAVPGSASACVTVTCPAAGPGILPGAQNQVSDQKPGSVLIYPVYASDAANGASQNTRLTITNTHPSRSANVHLFFVDGSSCSVADSYICLTANQTSSFLASDIDPGTTGYLVAIATDRAGCPTNFNYLIGDEFVKFSTGHAANLGAEAVAAIAGGLPACNANTDTTATLNFNGVSYNLLPRVIASSGLQSRADNNDTILIVDRIGGSLVSGAATINGLFGLLYDDAEKGVSFQIAATRCQLRTTINNDLRTTPRYEAIITAGRTGWMKLWSTIDAPIIGAQINRNTNSSSSAGAFNQGHNLHKLTLTNTGSYTIPVFPPLC